MCDYSETALNYKKYFDNNYNFNRQIWGSNNISDIITLSSYNNFRLGANYQFLGVLITGKRPQFH